MTGRSDSADGSDSGRYYLRLGKAFALVLLSIAVHLWIDGRRVDGRRPASEASGPATDIVLAPAAGRGAVALMSSPAGTVPAEHAAAGPATATGVTDSGADETRVVSTAGEMDRGEVPRARRRSLQPDFPDVAGSVPRPAHGVLRTNWLPDLARAENAVIPARRLGVWTRVDDGLPPVPVPALAPGELRGATASSYFTVAVTTAPVGTRPPVPPPASDDEASILQVLRRYERAVARKDPLGAKAVWPSLDDRALGRAFNDLQSHSLAFGDCGVTVDSVEARAICQGVATYLPKVGRRKPISASHEWTFNLAKEGGDWHIESAAIQ